MEMEEKYGPSGAAAYRMWEKKYNEIQKEVKFGRKSQDNPYLQLKKDISADADRFVTERQKMKKLAWIATLLSPVSLILFAGVASLIGNWALLLLIVAIVLPIYGFTSVKDYRKAMIAAIEFDEKYFGGEVFYKKKNGIPL